MVHTEFRIQLAVFGIQPGILKLFTAYPLLEYFIFMKTIILLFFIGTITGCASTPVTSNLEYTLVIENRIKEPRAHYVKIINRGIENIKQYAKSNGWSELSNKSVIDKAEVVFDRNALEKRVKDIYKVPKDTKMPSGLTAANDAKSMLVIMPEEESKKYAVKFVEPGFYEKLITHELAHLLHIKILNGDEDKMGPIWFYEGFPVVVSKQMESFKWSPTKKQAKLILQEPSRGDYRQYGVLVRMLLKKHKMKDLVARAGEKDFNDWALTQLF